MEAGTQTAGSGPDKKKLLERSKQSGPAKNLYAKWERPTVSCKVTWDRS